MTDERVTGLANSALLAAIGGFLDSFTYLGHGHVFACAMTGNVVLLGIYGLAQGQEQSLRHLPPILAFLLGVASSRMILMRNASGIIKYPYLLVLACEAAILLGLSLLPQSTSDFWINSSIGFTAALQVEAFRVVNGHSFNSTFTTGNLRSLSEGVCDWLTGNKKQEAAATVTDFGTICLTFMLGAVAGGFTTSRLGNRALWVDVCLLGVVIFRLTRHPMHATA